MARTEPKLDAKSVGSAPAQSSRGFIFAVIGIVVVGLAAVAIFATSRGAGEAAVAAGQQSAPIEIEGDALIPLPQGIRVGDASNDPMTGTVAPTLIATSFDGTEVRIEPDGQPKAIYFLAHWCPHCQTEVPLVQDLVDGGAVPEGMEIYAVSTGIDSGAGNFPPSEWFEAEGFTPTVVRDDEASSAFAGFGGAGFPYVVYLDAEHRVVARSSGSLDGPSIQQLWGQAVAAVG